jgi:hypothetical protein
MEVLKDYNDEEQNYIVNSGVLIYKYSKNQLIFKDKMSGDVNTNYLIEKKRNDEMGEKIKRLEDTIKNMESDSFKKEMDIKKKSYV